MGGEGVHNPYDDAELLVDIAAIQAALVIIDDEIEDLQEDVTDIMAVTDALPTLATVSGTTTTTILNTEYDMYIIDAPLGVFKPIVVVVNFLNQTATETVIVREYRRDVAAGVWTEYDEITYIGIHNAIKIQLDPNRLGIRTTIQRTAGTARAYPWSAFYEI